MSKRIKSLLFAVVSVGILYVAWYLISPLFISIEINEESPIIDDLLKFDKMQEKDFSDMEFDEAMTMLDGVEKEMNDSLQQNLRIIARVPLMPHGGHRVEGDAILIESGNQQILRYHNFETVNGPNLRVYLATDTTAQDFVDLGPLRGTKGSINYDIPAGTDLSRYKYALIWCVPFRVLFNSAAFEL